MPLLTLPLLDCQTGVANMSAQGISANTKREAQCIPIDRGVHSSRRLLLFWPCQRVRPEGISHPRLHERVFAWRRSARLGAASTRDSDRGFQPPVVVLDGVRSDRGMQVRQD